MLEKLKHFTMVCEALFKCAKPPVCKDEARAGVLGDHPLALLVIALDHINGYAEQIEQLQIKLKELKSDLLKYGQHSAGCNHPHGTVYGCKCGWLQTKQALKGE